jgi:hypothetical protein
MKACRREEFIQAYLDGELTPEAAEAMRRHLADCADCAAVRREMEQTLGLLDAAIRAETPETFPSARLLAAIESRLNQREVVKPSSAGLFWRFGFVATASLIILGLAGWFLGRTRPSTIPTVNDPSTARATAREAPSEEKKPAGIILDPPAPKRLAVHRRPAKKPPKDSEEEIVTKFFPLREGEDIRSLDRLQLVRIEVSSSALGEVGFPINQEISNEPIMADVVLGQDGLARAIRFVR